MTVKPKQPLRLNFPKVQFLQAARTKFRITKRKVQLSCGLGFMAEIFMPDPIRLRRSLPIFSISFRWSRWECCRKPEILYDETFVTKFYLKRNFKSCLTSCINGILRQAIVQLHNYVENALDSIGHEQFFGLKMLFFNFSNF